MFSRPFVYSKPRVAWQKSSCSLMRLHSIGFAHQDWPSCRRKDEADDRIIRSAAFASGLCPMDFPVLPLDVMEAFPSLRVHPLLFPTMNHLGFACVDP